MASKRYVVELNIDGKKLRGYALEVFASPKLEGKGPRICRYVPIKLAEEIEKNRDKIRIFLVVVKKESNDVRI